MKPTYDQKIILFVLQRSSPTGKSDFTQLDENENALKLSDTDEDSVLVADYQSDDEMATSCDSEEEKEGEPHVTKVCETVGMREVGDGR